MRREDIANFLNAERRISPLSAFSLLVVAGFIAGSLQLVGPQSQTVVATTPERTDAIAMTAAAYTSEYDDKANKTEYDSPAPESCTEAIKAALGKEAGPKVTAVDKGQNATMDACFGGVIKQGKKPSQKPEDYDCVGRKGEVKITKDSSTSITEPSREAAKGKCMITKVCQSFPALDGQPQKEMCSAPKKEFGAGQTTNSQNAGLPPMPQIPGGGGGGGGGSPEAPQPNAPQQVPQPQKPPTAQCSGVDPCGEEQPFKAPEEPKEEKAPPVTVCSGVDPCPTETTGGAKLNEFGEIERGAGGTYLAGEPKADASMLDPNADSGTTNAGTPRLQTSTFEPVEGGVGRIVNEDDQKTGGARSALGAEVRAQVFDGKWAETAGQFQSVQDDAALARSKLAQDAGINDIGKGKWTECADAYCMGDGSDPNLANAKVPGVLQTGCNSSECPPPVETKPTTTTPPPAGPPAKPPAGPPTAPPQQPPSTIPDAQTAPRQTTGGLGSFGGSGASGLMSFLGGLMKGLGVGQPQQPQQGPAQSCPTDPQAYAQYQQQYNYQLQQYNYQLEQYNYQVRNNSSYGYTNTVVPPVAPQPCRPRYGTDGNGQCPQLPAQPSAATCPTGTWRQMTASGAGMVCPVWQCVPNNATTPTAQIACNPDVAEKGSRVTISYTCTNSQRSTGLGFDTNGATAGATTVTLDDAPENAVGKNFAIKCEDGNVTAGAQCSVQLAKVSISLRAEPNPVKVGTSALIGWVTTGMKSCTVSSPDQEDFTARNASRTATAGIATTSPVVERSDFYVDCVTVTGENRQEKITLDAYRPGTISASIENRTDVVRGSEATLRWNFPDAPDASAVALWLYSVEEKKTVALITGHRSKTGTYSWSIPTEGEECDMSSSLVCGTDLIPGATYAILASLYQPVNANLGEVKDASLPEPKFIDNPISAAFKVVQ